MYKHCTTEESVLRQRQLERCLLDLMHTLPYAQITITNICDAAGISRKSFYRYFGSKDGCLYALIDHCIFDFTAQYLPGNSDAIHPEELFTGFFDYWKQMSPLLDALSKNNLSVCLAERMMIYADQEEPDFQYYLGNHTDDAYEQMLFMISGLVGLIIDWHRSGFQKSSGQMAAILAKILQT